MMRQNDYTFWLPQLSICLCTSSFFENQGPQIFLLAHYQLLAVVAPPEQGLPEDV